MARTKEEHRAAVMALARGSLPPGTLELATLPPEERKRHIQEAQATYWQATHPRKVSPEKLEMLLREACEALDACFKSLRSTTADKAELLSPELRAWWRKNRRRLSKSNRAP